MTGDAGPGRRAAVALGITALGIGSEASFVRTYFTARSIVVARLNSRAAHGMPPVGSTQVDAAGVARLEFQNLLVRVFRLRKLSRVAGLIAFIE